MSMRKAPSAYAGGAFLLRSMAAVMAFIAAVPAFMAFLMPMMALMLFIMMMARCVLVICKGTGCEFLRGLVRTA